MAIQHITQTSCPVLKTEHQKLIDAIANDHERPSNPNNLSKKHVFIWGNIGTTMNSILTEAVQMRMSYYLKNGFKVQLIVSGGFRECEMRKYFRMESMEYLHEVQIQYVTDIFSIFGVCTLPTLIHS